jgi:hypothetical protein
LSVHDVLTAVVGKLSGDVPSANWYLYDANIPKVTLPFGFVQEIPGVPNDTLPVAADYFPVRYVMGVTLLVTEGEVVYPSAEDAAIKAAIYPLRDQIEASLKETPQFAGAMRFVGRDAVVFSNFVGPMEYDARPWMGAHFEMSFIL